MARCCIGQMTSKNKNSMLNYFDHSVNQGIKNNHFLEPGQEFHLKMENGNKEERKRYRCNMCGKEYLTKQGLNLHLPSHMGIKPFMCSYCNKGFSQNGALKEI
ncbi:gastrula zinc finger protein xLCGF3.1-like [Saccostrea echinata]|uniref:gastrula zinc finger protein xLCGF3.1-like n=1 Tax=Saccostrea echinata TaxID=191078 RepID=UPI002A82F4B1|nr:gastrula zinc finger protein xLCGF3.1-like [Saccostrea echinata]